MNPPIWDIHYQTTTIKSDDKSYESWMSHVLLLLVYLKLSKVLN